MHEWTDDQNVTCACVRADGPAVKDAENRTARVMTLREIAPGEELYAEYGDGRGRGLRRHNVIQCAAIYIYVNLNSSVFFSRHQ